MKKYLVKYKSYFGTEYEKIYVKASDLEEAHEKVRELIPSVIPYGSFNITVSSARKRKKNKKKKNG